MTSPLAPAFAAPRPLPAWQRWIVDLGRLRATLALGGAAMLASLALTSLAMHLLGIPPQFRW